MCFRRGCAAAGEGLLVSPHIDILGERESLKRPFLGSIVLHLAIAATLVVYGISGKGRTVLWGDPASISGGSMTVGVVKQVPLPGRAGLVNPLANDTQSSVPQAPPQPKPATKAAEPEPDAIALKSRSAKKKPSPVPASRNTYRVPGSDRPNQLSSSNGQALVSPMVGMTGSGGIGVGAGSPFGNRFGYYVDLLRQRVAEKWRTSDVDARIQSAPPVVVTFTIRRNGSVQNVRIVTRSGNPVLDLSAQRAIYDAAPLPPLPAGFERDEATIEFWFELRR
jgi:protein TonB